MATLNVRLDDKLKNEAYAVLENSISPQRKRCDCCFSTLRKRAHAGENGDHQRREDALIQTVRERLANPQGN
jgi:RHH-type rel operon transcriptional repressor/antitoxin RelB